MGAGWDAADIVVEGRYEPYQEHAYLAGSGRQLHRRTGRHRRHRCPVDTRRSKQIAHALDLPRDQVQVIYPAIGGAFGGREDMSLQIVMALASWRLHQKAKIGRYASGAAEESIVGHHKRHRAPGSHTLGRIQRRQNHRCRSRCYLDAGAHTITSNKVPATSTYRQRRLRNSNARISSRCVYATATPGGYLSAALAHHEEPLPPKIR